MEMLTIEVDPGNSRRPAARRQDRRRACRPQASSATSCRRSLVVQAYAAAANATVGSVIQNKIGKAALVTIGCDGTGGVTKTNTVAGVNVGPTLRIGTGDDHGLRRRRRQRHNRPHHGRRSRMPSLIKVPVLGALVRFTAIKVVAEDKFNGSLHTRSTAGTQFARPEDRRALCLPINVARTPGRRPAVRLRDRQRADDPCRQQEGRHGRSTA